MPHNLKTPPAEEPLALAQVKSYLRITDGDDDTLISALITAVRQQCEAWVGRALVTQTWSLWLDRFPASPCRNAPGEGYFQLPVHYFEEVTRWLEIPRPPLQSISFLKTYDPANTAALFDASCYFVDTQSTPGRISLNQGCSWPTNLRAVNAVEIEFIAGYAVDVPEALKQGMLLSIKHLFVNRSKLFETDEPASGLLQFNQSMIPVPAQSMWMPYRIVGI